MKPMFRFRVNRVLMPHISIRREIVDGQLTGRLELVVRDDDIGWFAVDDNADLTDAALTKFVLEYRNETEWLELSPTLKRASRDKGWKKANTAEIITLLKSTGYVKVE